jgi:glucose-1-phosphate thymidylyltransferase
VNATIMLKPVPEPSHFGVAEVGKNNRIISLEEKPKKPKSNLAITGLYCFDRNIFTAAKSIKPSARGELEITDAISWLLHNGHKVDCHIVTGWWHDTGQKKDMLAASRSILGGMEKQAIRGNVDSESAVDGPVVIERGAKVVSSRITGPAIIGKGGVIEQSIIGPYTTIDRNAYISGSEVADSILLEGCRIVNLPGRLEQSLIGPDAYIGGGSSRPRTISVMLSEKSSVEVF